MPSIDGLSSGLNTTEIIGQLMQIERQPQLRLQGRQAAVESGIGALRALNAKFTAITAAADKLIAAKGWQLTTATSSAAPRAAATAAPGAAQGALSFSVTQLATASSVLSSGTVASTSAAVVPANTILTLSKGSGATVDVNTGDGSLGALMSAINKAGAGVSATAVQLVAGEYKLMLTSTTTGADTTPKLTSGDGSPVLWTAPGTGALDPFVTGTDAQLVLASGATVTRPSNTISDLLPGVTLTLLKPDAAGEPPVNVSVASDPEGTATQVAALVEALNAVRADIKAVTGYNLETKNKGKLYGDATVRGLNDRLASAVVGVGTTVAGVSLTREGTVTFDKEKFLKALAADPAAVQAALGGDGLASRLREVSYGASRSNAAAEGPGLLQTSITNRERQVSSLRSNISDWDQRLKLRQTTLQREFANLERALGASQRQGQWLAGQIAGLPRMGG